jgi:phosphatidylserine/phosphatidylglycerophosphate/cardiolipin synthase-like enzyme
MKKLIVFLILFFVGCDFFPQDPPKPKSNEEVCELSFDPAQSEALVINALDRARSTVDIALYGFDNDHICDALIDAAERGVVVRAVTEYDSEGEGSWAKLIDEVRDNPKVSIDIKLGNSGGIMHNKYFLIDKEYIITGSTNLTEGMKVHFNNMVLIKSPSLIEDFQRDFEIMYAGYFAGKKGGSDTNGFLELYSGQFENDMWPETQYTIGKYKVNAYFTPYNYVFDSYKADDPVEYTYFNYETGKVVSTADTTTGNYNNAMNIIFPLLENAEKSIYIFSFAFTDKVVIDQLIKAHNRGVTVKVWMDYMMYRSGMSHSGRSILALAKEIENFRICRDPDGGLLHHKVILVDGNIVVLGSLNFSANAVTSNDENFLVFRDASDIHDAFMSEAAKINEFSHVLRVQDDDFDDTDDGEETAVDELAVEEEAANE